MYSMYSHKIYKNCHSSAIFYLQVELAFAETFQKLHEIRTDTPVLPVFLSDHNVSEDVGAVNFNELHRLGFRKVSNHKFLDL